MEVHLIIQKDVHYMISGETRYSLFVKKYIYINENDWNVEMVQKKKKRNPKNSFQIKFRILYHANPELALA